MSVTYGEAAVAAGEFHDNNENIALKTGKKTSRLCKCDEDCLGGSKFINVAFGSLTFIITIALLVQIYYGDYQVIPHGSVATDSFECSEVGTGILKIGGNSIDASIASAFCLAVTTPHTTGLDAKGQIIIYSHRTKLTPKIIDFSHLNNSQSKYTLPQLVLGLIHIHQQYGTIRWKKLVEPSVKIARKGFLVPRMLVSAIQNEQAASLWGHLEAGQILKLEVLANTLQSIADIPEEELYNLIANQPNEVEAVKTNFYNYNVYVPDFPTGGPALQNILSDIEKHNFTTADTSKPEYTYRVAEIIQVVYEKFNISNYFHQGTSSNIAAIDLNDNYVSLVSGMNKLFGTKQMSAGGYVLDVKNNMVESSRIPIIITDSNFVCGRRIVFGANDIAIAAEILASLVIGGNNVTISIEAPRFDISKNGTIGLEESRTPVFNEDVLHYLETLSKELDFIKEPYNSCNIVEKFKDDLSSHSDSRGGGIASRF